MDDKEQPRELDDISDDLEKLTVGMIDAVAKVVKALKSMSTKTNDMAAKFRDLADMLDLAANLQLESAHSAAHLGADMIFLDRFPGDDDSDDEDTEDDDDDDGA